MWVTALSLLPVLTSLTPTADTKVPPTEGSQPERITWGRACSPGKASGRRGAQGWWQGRRGRGGAVHPPSALLTALRSSCTLKAPAGLPAAADTQINLHVALTKFQVERDVLARPAPELDWE